MSADAPPALLQTSARRRQPAIRIRYSCQSRMHLHPQCMTDCSPMKPVSAPGERNREGGGHLTSSLLGSLTIHSQVQAVQVPKLAAEWMPATKQVDRVPS